MNKIYTTFGIDYDIFRCYYVNVVFYVIKKTSLTI